MKERGQVPVGLRTVEIRAHDHLPGVQSQRPAGSRYGFALWQTVDFGKGLVAVTQHHRLALLDTPRQAGQMGLGLMNIHLIEAADRILPMMSENSSSRAYQYLTHMGVKVWLNTRVSNYDGLNVTLTDGTILRSSAFIWTAGVKGAMIPGINEDSVINNRYIVNGFNQVQGYDNIFSIGDVAAMINPAYPKGHPLLAMPAIQQGKRLAGNLKRMLAGRAMNKFTYTDLGVLATIGRNKAVAELPFGRFSGFFAWFLWMFIHLVRLIGFRNRIIILIEWMFSYFTYEYSFRIITQNGKNNNPKSNS